jgi:aminoglycoside phosphotransferase (APT) family kinase protein
MPFLARALDPREVQQQLQHCCPGLTSENQQIHLCAIRVTRYKPGRRCLIEYDLKTEQSDDLVTLVGKVRSRGLDQSSYHLLQSLWNTGFAANSADGISVPEPVGVIPEFQMWLQRKVPGAVATELLPKSDGVALATQIAAAVHKLHQAGIPTHRRHTIADELRILHERLPLVAQMKPQWTGRLQKILDACDQLGSATPEPSPRGIHRDFYSDQVIVDGSRLYLLDFDLYCEGDPALDIGNFLGHITEQSLRTLGNPDALADREKAMKERFQQISGNTTDAAVSAYTTLTLVRHIYLSTQFPERCQFTENLLDLCEQRLG